MSNFRMVDRETGFLLPPSVDDWLPEQHLARFVVEVVEGLDLRGMSGSYRGSGSASYHPQLLLALLVYGYATGVFSSRKLERASYDSVAFRFVAANQHPDHDTIAVFRRRFLKEIEGLFVQVLLLARELGVLKLGTVGLDGTKIHANASRHSALSHEHAGKIEAQLRAEVAELMAKAEAADQADLPDGFSIPDELARRQDRIGKIAEARAKIEARAKEREAREQAEYEAKLAARQAKQKRTGKKPGGKPPSPPASGPLPSDQINLTDEDSRIMPVAGGGFEQCYNAQAVVAAGSLLVVAAAVVQAANDKQQLAPMLDQVMALPEQLGRPNTLLADSGYFSATNVDACTTAGIAPLIPTGRQTHYPPLSERLAKPPLPPESPTSVEAMAHRLKTPEGKSLYALRKQTPEPVFGIIKSVMGFRQFSLRGLQKVRGEWSLVTMAWNIKRMFALRPA
ncbi:MAG: IS1182 family transposase [Rhizobiales bacterium]|nr:IS1182 family transposase [Hyphomicrobiales bacterium]